MTSVIRAAISTISTRSLSRFAAMLAVAAFFLLNENGELLADDAKAKPSAGEAKKADESSKPDKEKPLENPFPNRVKATSFDGGTEWLNTSGEITLSDVRGKIVLLDFWTYCCINCMHVLPDLAYLEKKYANEIVVIGVHSPNLITKKTRRIFAARLCVTKSNIPSSMIRKCWCGASLVPGPGPRW